MPPPYYSLSLIRTENELRKGKLSLSFPIMIPSLVTNEPVDLCNVPNRCCCFCLLLPLSQQTCCWHQIQDKHIFKTKTMKLMTKYIVFVMFSMSQNMSEGVSKVLCKNALHSIPTFWDFFGHSGINTIPYFKELTVSNNSNHN